MRLFLLVLIALSLVSGNAFADDKELVDTGKGLQFEKRSGWATAVPKKGAVAALTAAGDPSAQIEFRWARVEPAKLKQYFNSFHSSLATSLRRVGEPQQKTFGKVSGVFTEYETGSKDAGSSVVVFEFSQGDSAWLVVGMFTREARDSHVRDLEKMLGTIVVAAAKAD